MRESGDTWPSGRAALDCLGHDELAAKLAFYGATMPVGAVIAIQGSWGRGKTDVLARVFERAKESDVHAPLWLNPWRYGVPDLIAPLVADLVTRLSESDRRSPKLRAIVKSLIRAANATVFRGIGAIIPAKSLLERWGDISDDLINEMFEAPDSDLVDEDPIAAMSARFRELVGAVLGNEEGRLVVCIDDIDRCLPSHQITMLESLHFLTSAGARCTFFVAIDPHLVKEAAATHYGTENFDTERYLDKIFDLRVELRGLRADDAARLVGGFVGQLSPSIEDTLGITSAQLVEILEDQLLTPSLRNPRFLHRLVQRLHLLALSCAQDSRRWPNPDEFGHVLSWLCLSIRFPAARSLFQGFLPSPGLLAANLYGLQVALSAQRPYWLNAEYTNDEGGWREEVDRCRRELGLVLELVPNSGELGIMLVGLGESTEAAERIVAADEFLQSAGL